MKSLRVLTYNICGARGRRDTDHVKGIAELIRSTKADVVGLQEVYQGERDHGDQPGRLAELTGMECVYLPHRKSDGSRYGNAILTHGRVLRSLLHVLPGRFPETRSLLQAEILLEDLRFEFFCTHLVHFGMLMSRSRRGQVRHIARQVEDCHLPRIVAGDLNTGQRDLGALAHAGLFAACSTVLPTHPASRPWRSLDHIWTCASWRCADFGTLPCLVSDHLPLTAELVPVIVDPNEPVLPPAATNEPLR